MPRPSSVNRIAAVGAIATTAGSGAVSESDFEKAFTDVPHVNVCVGGVCVGVVCVGVACVGVACVGVACVGVACVEGRRWRVYVFIVFVCFQIFTQSDLEKAVVKVAEVTGNAAISWDVRVNAVGVLYLECYGRGLPFTPLP